MREYKIGDYVVSTIDKSSILHFEGAQKITDIYDALVDGDLGIIQVGEIASINDDFTRDEVEFAYLDRINEIQNTCLNNGFVSLTIPTKENPYLTIKMERGSFSSRDSSFDKDREVEIDKVETQNNKYKIFGLNEINAKLVRELRKLTRRGIMECKRALQDANGDMKEAQKLLKIRR